MTTPKYDLPTAIRIGAEMSPQIHNGSYYDGHGTCAVGAAIKAECPEHTRSIFDLWPELAVFIDDDKTLFNALIGLNDNARWTREEIADWVDMVLP